MIVYVTVAQEHTTGTTVSAHATESAAIRAANTVAANCAKDLSTIDDSETYDYIHYVRWGTEDDCAWVEAVPLEDS